MLSEPEPQDTGTWRTVSNRCPDRCFRNWLNRRSTSALAFRLATFVVGANSAIRALSPLNSASKTRSATPSRNARAATSRTARIAPLHLVQPRGDDEPVGLLEAVQHILGIFRGGDPPRDHGDVGQLEPGADRLGNLAYQLVANIGRPLAMRPQSVRCPRPLPTELPNDIRAGSPRFSADRHDKVSLGFADLPADVSPVEVGEFRRKLAVEHITDDVASAFVEGSRGKLFHRYRRGEANQRLVRFPGSGQ